MKAKILMLDIETAPSSAYIWRLWQEVTNMDMVAEDWYILCWCAKWAGEKTIHSSALPDHSLYKTKPASDLEIMKPLWKLLDEADIVVAHNGIKFDIKKINTRFLMHKLPPPSPYKVVDTLRVARGQFAFMSNRLNDLGQLLGVGKKQDTGGFQLWLDCLAGNKAAWKKMVSYCTQDVVLLERVYDTLMPYAKRTPNLGVYSNEVSCPKCGSAELQKRGYAYTNLSKFQRFACKACGSWSRARQSIKQKKELLANV